MSFPVFFFLLSLFILFMCWNSGDWLMQLTCSHHEFSLHHYMGTLQEQGSCDYRDAINMRTLTETHTQTHTHVEIPDTLKPMHLFRWAYAYQEMLSYSGLQYYYICSSVKHTDLTLLGKLQYVIKGIVPHFGKSAHLFSFWDIDENKYYSNTGPLRPCVSFFQLFPMRKEHTCGRLETKHSTKCFFFIPLLGFCAAAPSAFS